MKLSTSLLQAITLGVSVTALSAAATSCEKQKIKENQERINDSKTSGSDTNQAHPDSCPACGMG